MEIKYIYWFSYFNLQEPSVRYRAKYALENLKIKYNIPYRIVYPGYDANNLINFLHTFILVLFFRKRNSVIVFQKIYSTGIYATALKIILFFRPANTLYDIDDAEYVRRPAGTMHHFMRKCSACSAGSSELISYISKFNSNVFYLTSPVINHDSIKKRRNEVFTVGWIGYYSAHRKNLTELFFPDLLKISFQVKFVLLGVRNKSEENEIKNYFASNSNIVIETPLSIDWFDEFSIYEKIKTFDVGLSPLLDTEFNRCKSAFKLKQCLSCGVPVLGSSIGENMRFIDHDRNGYFCDKPGEYYDKLLSIKELSESRYMQLSHEARMSFSAFSVEQYCLDIIEYYSYSTGD